MRAASAEHTSGRSLSTCVVAVWLSWGSHDYLQELVFHHGFHHAIFMALSLQVTSFLLSTVHEAALNRWSHTYARYQSASVAAPYHTMCLWYCSVSVCIALANGLSTSALNYVDMATKVMFKSSKIVVVMCTGSLLFARRYKALEYGAMALACSGLMVFSLSGLPATLGHKPVADAREDKLFGMGLLASAVVVDSVLPNAQQHLLQTLGRSKEEVVRATNAISALFSLAYVAASGELVAACAFLAQHEHIAALLLLQAVAGYVGVLAFLETVRIFGSKVTTIVTSLRKLVTILVSTIAFSHPFNVGQLLGVLAVFGGLLANNYVGSRWTVRCLPLSLGGMTLVLALLLVPSPVATEPTGGAARPDERGARGASLPGPSKATTTAKPTGAKSGHRASRASPPPPPAPSPPPLASLSTRPRRPREKDAASPAAHGADSSGGPHHHGPDASRPEGRGTPGEAHNRTTGAQAHR